MLTSLYIDFSDAQGQLTLQSEVESRRNSTSAKLLWLSLLQAQMKKIQPKMKALEGQQHFSYYNSIGIFSDAQGQLTQQRVLESG